MKSLFLHLPGETYRVVIKFEDTFDREVDNLERILGSEGSCWIPVHTDEVHTSKTHIFLTDPMKSKVYLRTVVSN